MSLKEGSPISEGNVVQATTGALISFCEEATVGSPRLLAMQNEQDLLFVTAAYARADKDYYSKRKGRFQRFFTGTTATKAEVGYAMAVSNLNIVQGRIRRDNVMIPGHAEEFLAVAKLSYELLIAADKKRAEAESYDPGISYIEVAGVIFEQINKKVFPSGTPSELAY